MPVRLSDFGKQLLGRPKGQSHFGRLCETLVHEAPATVVLLDFSDIENVNASWLNAAISPLLPWCARPEIDVFPVLCCFPASARDELELVSRLNNQCFPVAQRVEEATRSVELVGPLESALETTIRVVLERGDVTGADLGRDPESGGIGPTGWNNRLRELFERRLLTRRNIGRKQMYSPLAKEMVRHG
jgi:hypothetical protein